MMQNCPIACKRQAESDKEMAQAIGEFLYVAVCMIVVLMFTCNVIYFLSRSEAKIGHINSFFELEAEDIDKKVVKFDQFKGKVTVITNVASYCGEFYFLLLNRPCAGEIYVPTITYRILYGGV